MWAYSLLLCVPIVLVFVRYNYYALNVLVYAGWILLAFSAGLIFVAGGEFRKKGGVPPGKHLVHTTVVVDSGIYAVVRHPQYVGFLLCILALVLMSQHWLSIVTSAVGSTLFYRDILREEQMSLTKFGDAYKRYMERVPRMNILLGTINLLSERYTTT